MPVPSVMTIFSMQNEIIEHYVRGIKQHLTQPDPGHG
jgi:hypothetical protein